MRRIVHIGGAMAALLASFIYLNNATGLDLDPPGIKVLASDLLG
jgi:hypothetical protein